MLTIAITAILSSLITLIVCSLLAASRNSEYEYDICILGNMYRTIKEENNLLKKLALILTGIIEKSQELSQDEINEIASKVKETIKED